MAAKVVTVIEDVGGSFERFFRLAPKLMRQELGKAVKASTESVEHRMVADAPLGPIAPHIKHDIDSTSRGLGGQAGIIDDDEQAHIALYNEYGTRNMHAQPFMMPAAEQEARGFRANAIQALRNVERALSVGSL